MGEKQRWRPGALKSNLYVSQVSWRWVLMVTVSGTLICYAMTLMGSASCRSQPEVLASDVRLVASPGKLVPTAVDAIDPVTWSGDVRDMSTAWNRLCYGLKPPATVRIALFVKKWPTGGTPGGLERHAMTLHRALADRGHVVHAFTMRQPGAVKSHEEEEAEEERLHPNMHVHFFEPNQGIFDHSKAWEKFNEINATDPFDIVHSESVALPHWRAVETGNTAASWHGIAYETIHSDIVEDLVRKAGETRGQGQTERLNSRLVRVIDEVRFFPSYKHHVATSDYVADVLRTIYELPLQNVHTILNGVDEQQFRPNPAAGAAFRTKYGVPSNASLVIGAAGRLVRDKGHPLLFEALSEILKTHKDVYLLVAGSGPWASRYEELAPNVITVGPLTPLQLADFYNSVDILANPTLRAQGLDITLLEAMQCGKPLLATRFSSIVWSVVKDERFGYTFSPNVQSLLAALKNVVKDGKEKLLEKGQMCSAYASKMFTAKKMASAYERLFLCMKNETYCKYPLPTDEQDCTFARD